MPSKGHSQSPLKQAAAAWREDPEVTKYFCPSTSLVELIPKSPGRIPKMDPPKGSIIYTMGVVEVRIGGSLCWLFPGLWV